MIAIRPRIPPATATLSRTSTSAITISTAISPPTIVTPFLEPLERTRDPYPLSGLGNRTGRAGRGEYTRLVSEDTIERGFKEGDKVWVQDADGNRHPGIFVGDNEASGWFGGGPSAYVAHPEAHQAEVVSVFRITPRDD